VPPNSVMVWDTGRAGSPWGRLGRLSESYCEVRFNGSKIALAINNLKHDKSRNAHQNQSDDQKCEDKPGSFASHFVGWLRNSKSVDEDTGKAFQDAHTLSISLSNGENRAE